MLSAIKGAARIHFWIEQDTWMNLEFQSTFNGKLEEL
jgi:hypothetical protein